MTENSKFVNDPEKANKVCFFLAHKSLSQDVAEFESITAFKM